MTSSDLSRYCKTCADLIQRARVDLVGWSRRPLILLAVVATTSWVCFLPRAGAEAVEPQPVEQQHAINQQAHETPVEGPPVPPGRWRPMELAPGEVVKLPYATETGDAGHGAVLKALPANVPIRRFGFDSGRAGGTASGEQGDDDIILYSNTEPTLLFAPGVDRRIGDDFQAFASAACRLTAYEVMVSGGGNGSGDPFSVDVALFEGCPSDGGIAIQETVRTFLLPDDGMFLLRHEIDGDGVPAPMSGWLRISFSTAQAGIPVGTPAETGFTADIYDFPTVPCEAGFGPTLYAGFHLRVYGTSNCEPFSPTQVNVDEDGNNIPFDAANEPSIAVDPTNPDRIAIGWRQFDTIANSFRQAGFAYTEDGGQTWTFPGVIEPGIFRSDPVLDFDAEGTFYYNSLTTPNNFFMTNSYTSVDGGKTWGPSVFAYGGDKQWTAVDRTEGIGRGHIYQAWSPFAGCCGNNTFNRSTDGGVSFEEAIAIPFSPRFGTLSVGPGGELYVAGVVNANVVAVVRSDSAKDADLPVVFEQAVLVDLGGIVGGIGAGPNPAGLLGQLWVATDHSKTSRRGNVYLMASTLLQGTDPMDLHFVRSEDGGATFTTPTRINQDPPAANAWQWMGTMSVAPSGRIDVVWLDTSATNTAQICQLYYAFSIDGGETWSEGAAMTPLFDSHAGWPQQNKMGDYFDMISHDDYAYLAYSATFTGGQDVYFLKIPADCNENGIADVDEIADGTAADCNGNLALDICEPQDDCNGNSILDICELAGGTGDCNGNFIIDECESQSDCDDNGVQDICDVAAGNGSDCNANQILDACEIADGLSADCNTNGLPDECDLATVGDCNANQIPDDCDLSSCKGEPQCSDCNRNGVIDVCDLIADCNANQVPDECESQADCDGNFVLDICDISSGEAEDCNGNQVPDSCDLAEGASSDCGWGPSNCCTPHDEPGCANPEVEACVCDRDPTCCEVSWGPSCIFAIELFECADCETLTGGNGVPDECDIAQELTVDCNLSSSPDNCDLPFDFNSDSVVDLVDFGAFYECLISPGGGGMSPCCFFDRADDGEIDLREFAGIQNGFDP